MNPGVFAGVVIVFMFFVLAAAVLLIGDGRKSVEGENQEILPPHDSDEWL